MGIGVGIRIRAIITYTVIEIIEFRYAAGVRAFRLGNKPQFLERRQVARWEIRPFAHTCASLVGISMEPPVVSRDWRPVSSNKARGYCCRTLRAARRC
jgi:hypothetical protein